jgi:hypothetical protein
MVKAKVPRGKYAGEYSGRIAIRQRASFKLNGLFDVHPKYLQVIQRSDGYTYQYYNNNKKKEVADASPVSEC